MQKTIQESHQPLTRSEWEQLCADWERSGEKQPVFCKNRKINYGTFVYWRMKFKKEKKPVEQNLFSMVNLVKPAVSSSFKIHLPNGIGFTLPTTTDKGSLKVIFELLGVIAC